jgi:predicted nucleotidyltransferase
MNIDLIQDKVLNVVAAFSEISLVYLFGSQVTGNIGPLSDIDLGVVVDHAAMSMELQARLAHEFGRSLGTDRIDVVLLNRAPVELVFSVIAQGVLLYERSLAEKVEYEATVMSRYYDYLPILRAQREDILRGDPDGKRVQRYREALERTERTLREIAGSKDETAPDI